MLIQMYWLLCFMPAATPLLRDRNFTSVTGKSQGDRESRGITLE